MKRHIESKSHIDNSLTAEDFLSVADNNTPSILKSISASHEETVRRNRHILKCIIEVLLTLAKQNIAIRGHTEDRSNFFALLHLCAKSDAVLADHLANAADNSKYTSPDIQNELIEICGNEVKEVLLKECREAPCFAILADETTDKSTKIQLSVCVRFVKISDETVFVKEVFLGFVHAHKTDGETIAKLLFEFLEMNNLCADKLRAQGYDGAGNMSGKHNGVQARVKAVAPDAVYVHCKAHCLNLAIIHACKIPCVRTMMATVQEVGFAFDYSAKRLEAYLEELSADDDVQAAMDKKTKLQTLCETRWVSRSDALTTFKRAFPVVVHSLESLHQDSDEKAGLHIAAVSRFEFIIALIVCEHALRLLVHLSVFLQDQSCDMLAALEECKVVIAQLRAERTDDQVWDALFQEAIDLAQAFGIQPCIPRRAGRQQHRNNAPAETPSEYWKITLYNVFVDHLLMELEQRLIIAEPKFKAFNLLPRKVNDFDEDHLNVTFDAYKADIIGDRDDFRAEVHRWSLRWAMAAHRPASVCDTIKCTNPHLYPSIFKVLVALLTIPVSTATAERSFSCLKRLKTYLRSTMGQTRLQNLAILHSHSGIDVNEETVINVFADKKKRNLNFVF